jgi:hypothetical protein
MEFWIGDSLRLSRKPAESQLSPVETVPLAALPGFEGTPAFSADGNQVAFLELLPPIHSAFCCNWN